jgi:predicted tellurium resistance membrane protein TerC
VILTFIGVKLVLHFAHLHHHAVPELSTGASLGVIVVILAATTIASLRTVRRDPTRRAHPGSLRPTRRSEPAADTR